MEYIVVIFFFILLVTVCRASTQNNRVKSCSRGLYWDDNSHQCQSCPVGYYGPTCSLPCRYPNYGAKCQQMCNCTEEYCTSDKGCVNNSTTDVKTFHSDPTERFSTHSSGVLITFYDVTTFKRGRSDAGSSEEEFNVEKYILRSAFGIFALLCILLFVVFIFRRRKNVSNNRKTNNDCESYEALHREDNPCSLSHSYTSPKNEDLNNTQFRTECGESLNSYASVTSVVEQSISQDLSMTITFGTVQNVAIRDTSKTTEKDFPKSLHVHPNFRNTDADEDFYEDMVPVCGNSFPNVEHTVVQPSSSESVHTHEQAVNIAADINENPCKESGDGHENISSSNATSINEEPCNRNESNDMSITKQDDLNSESAYTMMSPTNSVYVHVSID